MAKFRSNHLSPSVWRRALFLFFFLLLLYVIIPRIDSLSASLPAIKAARPQYVALGLAFLLLSYIVGAITYCVLALKPLRFRETVAVQTAGAFANRLLPAGLGGLTLNVQYLRKAGHTTGQAVIVAGINNFIGFAGHLLILGVALFFVDSPFTEPSQKQHVDVSLLLLILAAIICLLLLALAFKSVRQRFDKAVKTLKTQIGYYRGRPSRLIAALCSSSVLTSCYILTLYMSVHALGVDLSVVQVLMVFSAGMLAGAVTPTPGGLVGIEAAMAAGFTAYGIEPSLAVAIALLFRLITYWLPLIPGFIVFILARRLYS